MGMKGKVGKHKGGNRVHVDQVGMCVLWSPAPGQGSWWAIVADESSTAAGRTIRIRWNGGRAVWTECYDQIREKAPKPKRNKSNTIPLF
jgi:hypothetical protein